jgi:hypothetical protein
MAELISIPHATDFEEIASFQRRAFGDEWLKSERRRLQRAEYYQWKYNPPAGPAWLALVRSQQDIIAICHGTLSPRRHNADGSSAHPVRRLGCSMRMATAVVL